MTKKHQQVTVCVQLMRMQYVHELLLDESEKGNTKFINMYYRENIDTYSHNLSMIE